MHPENRRSGTKPANSGFTRRSFLGALTGAVTACAFPVPGYANLTTLPGNLPLSSAMRTGDYHRAPPGWFKFIKRHPKLSPAGHAQMSLTQQQVNRLIRFRPERKDRWQLVTSAGDCEDYAIRKLDILCNTHGWPRSALTIAACYTEHGQGHAVLLVHTDKGVYALDNRRRAVEPWRRLPYRWIAREEHGAPFGLWRALAV